MKAGLGNSLVVIDSDFNIGEDIKKESVEIKISCESSVSVGPYFHFCNYSVSRVSLTTYITLVVVLNR